MVICCQQLQSVAIRGPEQRGGTLIVVWGRYRDRTNQTGRTRPVSPSLPDRSRSQATSPAIANARTCIRERFQESEFRLPPQYHLKFTSILIETATGFPESMAGLNRYCFTAFTACASKSERNDFTI